MTRQFKCLVLGLGDISMVKYHMEGAQILIIPSTWNNTFDVP